MPTQTAEMVDFHLPLPWFLDISLTTGQMVANVAVEEDEVQLADGIASLLSASVQHFGAEILYPGDRFAKWGTPAERGQMRRFIARIPEAYLQEYARGARLVAEQVIRFSGSKVTSPVVVTRAGDESDVLF